MGLVLTPVELEIATYVAKLRGKSQRSKGVQDDRIDENNGSVDIDIQGFQAEMACCKLHNTYPDFDIGKAKLWDFVSKSGLTVDVKSTHYTTGKLLVIKSKKGVEIPLKSDAYALMIIDSGRYIYKGYAARDVLKQAEIINYKDGTSYSMPATSLTKELVP